jgi:predicted xylose isomerase-like sugar epimerase
MTYKIQIDDVVRNATAMEIAEIEARAEIEANRLAAQLAEAEAKASAKSALLVKLGITGDQAKLLLS